MPTVAEKAAAPTRPSTPTGGSAASRLRPVLVPVLLALIVLIIAWLLRRANAARDRADAAGAHATEAMVRERIQDIDLTLDPAASRSPRD